MMRRRDDLIAIAFLVALVTIFFARELFTDATLVTYRLVNFYPWLTTATQKDLDQPSITSDCALSYYPRRVFATETIRQGKMPFWNPHQFCGTPFFANFQSAVLYPVNLAIYWLPPPTQMDVFIYAHFLIAVIFGFLLGRKLGFSRGASVVASMSYAFCGFMVTRFGQPTLVSTASWLPAVIWSGERLVESPSFRRAGLLALVLSLAILAGFPQVVLFVVYALFLYVLLRVALSRGQAGPRVRTLVFLAVAAVCACFVCAFQLLPTYELSGFSYRRVLPYSMILSSAHHPLVAFKYFVPDVLGDPLETSVISKALFKVEEGPKFAQNYVSTTGYIGILPIALAVLALLRPNRRLLPFVVLAGLALFTVFGSPLLHLFYKVLPGFNFSRIDRVVVLFMFGACMLAGYGYDRARAPGKRALLVFGLGFIAFAIGLALWLRFAGFGLILSEAGASLALPSYVAYASGKLVWFVLLAAACSIILVLAGLRRLSPRALFIAAIAVLLVDLMANGVKFKISQPADQILPKNATVDSLEAERGQWRIAKFRNDVLPANLPTIVGIDDIHGYDALNVSYYLEMLGALDSSLTDVSNAALRRRIGPITSEAALASPLLDLLNARYILTATKPPVGRRKIEMLDNEDFLPRAFLVGRARHFADYETMLAYLKRGQFDPRSEVLLQGSGSGDAPASGQSGDYSRLGESVQSLRSGESQAPVPLGQELGDAKIVQYDAGGLTVQVDARAKCYLVVSDVFYPGWRATVDGRAESVLRADYAFRAVPLEAGSHRVRMTYGSSYFRIGLLFTAAAIALVALMISLRPLGSPSGGGPD